MDEKLDAYRPAPETVAAIKHQLLKAGVQPETIIADEWIAAIIAAQSKWQAQTAEGLVYTAALLGFDSRRGLDDQCYSYIHPETGEVKEYPSHKVAFYAGASLYGKPVNPHNILISKKLLNQCESCGISAHCLKDIRDPRRDLVEKLCNTCITLSDSPTINQHGEQRICRDCTVKSCAHHPQTTNQNEKEARLKLA